MYKDVNGDGVINYMDECLIGYCSDSIFIFNFGINLLVSWKGFDLVMDWMGLGMILW